MQPLAQRWISAAVLTLDNIRICAARTYSASTEIVSVRGTPSAAQCHRSEWLRAKGDVSARVSPMNPAKCEFLQLAITGSGQLPCFGQGRRGWRKQYVAGTLALSVTPNCGARREEVMQNCAEHARTGYGMAEIPSELAANVEV